MAARRSFARDFRDLHGQDWPPEGEALNVEASPPEVGETLEVEVLRPRPHIRRGWEAIDVTPARPRARLGLGSRVVATLAVLYAMAGVGVAFAIVAVLAWVALSALLG